MIRTSIFVLATRTRTLASWPSFNHRGFGFDISPPGCLQIVVNLSQSQ